MTAAVSGQLASNSESRVALAVLDLAKTYRAGLRMKRVRALDGVSFEVQRGEIFGFVGPNGAGKTTTIRALMGLIRPSAGRCLVLGHRVPSRKARERIGFLPESPYFYEYLTAREMLDLAGRLFGLEASTRRARAAELVERVGLAGAADRPLRKFSKGMLQRAGLAQALVNRPELVVLDEPMSGLDPVGRKDVRELILELRDAGTTVFFSTHILSDVETICDRVAIIAGGRVHDVGPVGKLLDGSVLGTDVVLRVRPGADLAAILPAGARLRRIEEETTVSLAREADVQGFVRAACELAELVSVVPRRESLEDLFIRRTRQAAGGGA